MLDLTLSLRLLLKQNIGHKPFFVRSYWHIPLSVTFKFWGTLEFFSTSRQASDKTFWFWRRKQAKWSDLQMPISMIRNIWSAGRNLHRSKDCDFKMFQYILRILIVIRSVHKITFKLQIKYYLRMHIDSVQSIPCKYKIALRVHFCAF